MKRVVIFEELAPSHAGTVSRYLARGCDVRYLRLNARMQGKVETLRIGRNSVVTKAAIEPCPHTFEAMYCDEAFKNVDTFFACYADTYWLKRMRELYGTGKTDLIFKKALTEKLSRFYYLNFVFSRLEKLIPDGAIVFVPSDGIEPYNTDGCEAYDYIKFLHIASLAGAEVNQSGRVEFALSARFRSRVNALIRQIMARARVLALPIYYLMAIAWGRFQGAVIAGASYAYAFMLISPARQFANSIQRFDFLMDELKVAAKNCILISYKKLTEDHAGILRSRRLAYIDDMDRMASLRDVVKIIPYCMAAALSAGPAEMSGAVSLSLYHYVRWAGFLRRCAIDRFVTYCDFSSQSIARNLLLERAGCRTYYYMDSANLGCFLADEKGKVRYRHSNFGFIRYDYMAVWNREAARYFKDMGCEIGSYEDIGCLWTEHLAGVKGGRLGADIRQRLYRLGFKDGMKLVAVFDSSFNNDSITTYGGGVAFLEGIMRLRDEMPDIFIVLKEKMGRRYHDGKGASSKEAAGIYARLDSESRFYLPGNRESSSEIMANSDLVISFPFTSTSFEALAAGKRAVWFDATDKFRGTFYDKIPGLVCHGQAELSARVRRLLYDMGDEEYARYLNAEVKGKVESHMDGKAITRFVGLLSEGR